MKPLNFKKLFCVLLSASILLPSVANADTPQSVPQMPKNSSSKSAEFMKKNWPYFAAGVPGAAIIIGAICYTAKHGGKEKDEDVDNDTREKWWNEFVKGWFTYKGELPGAVVFRYDKGHTGRPYYFYVIINSSDFNCYLYDRLKFSLNNMGFVKSLANRIFDKDALRYWSSSYPKVFPNGNVEKFVQDLSDAIESLDKNAVCNDAEKFTGNKTQLKDGTQEIEVCVPPENFNGSQQQNIDSSLVTAITSSEVLKKFIDFEGGNVSPEDMATMTHNSQVKD